MPQTIMQSWSDVIFDIQFYDCFDILSQIWSSDDCCIGPSSAPIIISSELLQASSREIAGEMPLQMFPGVQ